MEYLSSSVGVNELTRSECLATALRYRVVNACFIRRTAECKPSHVKVPATVLTDARAGLRAGRDLPAIIADFNRRAEALPRIGRFTQDVMANSLVADLPIHHVA